MRMPCQRSSANGILLDNNLAALTGSLVKGRSHDPITLQGDSEVPAKAKIDIDGRCVGEGNNLRGIDESGRRNPLDGFKARADFGNRRGIER